MRRPTPTADVALGGETVRKKMSPKTMLVLACALILALGLLVGSAIALSPHGDAAGRAGGGSGDVQLDQVEGDPALEAGTQAPAAGTGATAAGQGGKGGALSPGAPGSLAPAGIPTTRRGSATTTTIPVVSGTPTPTTAPTSGRGSTSTSSATFPRGAGTTTTSTATTTSTTTPPSSTTTPPPATRDVEVKHDEHPSSSPDNSPFRRYTFDRVAPGQLRVTVAFAPATDRQFSVRIYVGPNASYDRIIADCPPQPTSPLDCATATDAASTVYTVVVQGDGLPRQGADIKVDVTYRAFV